MLKLIKELGEEEKILRTDFRNLKKHSKLRNLISRKMRKVLELAGSGKIWGFVKWGCDSFKIYKKCACM